MKSSPVFCRVSSSNDPKPPSYLFLVTDKPLEHVSNRWLLRCFTSKTVQQQLALLSHIPCTKLHYMSLRPGARHRMRRLWLVFIIYPWKVTCSWVSGPKCQAFEGKKGIGYDCVRARSQNCHLCMYVTERETKIDRRESSYINNWRARSGAGVGEKVMYLVLLRVHSAWLRGGRKERDTHWIPISC